MSTVKTIPGRVSGRSHVAITTQHSLGRCGVSSGTVTSIWISDDEFFYVPQAGPHDPRFNTAGLVPDVLPGANGSLEGECEVVLGWLLKAGYEVILPAYQNLDISTVILQRRAVGVSKDAGPLHEALAAAVKALPREDAP